MRIAGGPLSPSSLFPTVSLQPCSDVGGDESTQQQWLLDQPVDGYIQAKASGSTSPKCLNADDCQQDLIVYSSCPTDGCCNNCDNMVFRLDAADTGYITAGTLMAHSLLNVAQFALPLMF